MIPNYFKFNYGWSCRHLI